MIDSITRITLNLQETNTMVSIRAKRGDTGRKLLIHLSDGSIPYHISDDCYTTFTAKKPDGTKINNACTIVNNVIEYEFTEQTCTAVGTMKAEIRLYGADDKMITSACFLVNVYDTVFRDGDEVDSESEMNTLDDLILRANAFLNETGKLLRWQGNWDSETEYEANDLVLHEEVLYVAEEAIAAGTVPGSEGAAWVPIAGMGTGGGTGDWKLPTITAERYSDSTNGTGVMITTTNYHEDGSFTVESELVNDGKNGVSPQLKLVKVEAIGADEDPSGSISGPTNYQTLSLKIPKGQDGEDYVLTDADKAEIAEMAAELVEVPEHSGGNVDLTGYATEQFVRDGYQPKGNYLTEHQDISGKLDANKLPEAINDALAQAKESGEFDGADGHDGYTPQKGVDYNDGADGKSAYQYAKEGGYTGTEAEFSAMLSSEGYGYVAQPEPPADTNLLWLDTDDESADASGAQADWNAPEGQPGHILNRTHYDYIAKVVEEITINASSSDTTFTAASPIVIGETYSIHWGDEIYVCEAVDGAVMAPEGAGYPVLGNYGNLIGGTDTGEPFVIMVMGTNGMVIGFGEDIEITFSIDGKTTKKISEKYLPAFVKSCIIPVNSFENKIAKITLDTTELAEAIKNNYPIYVEKIAGYNAERYTVNRVLLTILPEAGINTMTQAIDWHIAMGYSVSNLPVHLYFSDGWGDNSYSVYININE